MTIRILTSCFFLSLPLLVSAQSTSIVRYQDLDHPVFGDSGMVAAQNQWSAQAGADVLSEGGSAVDAAIATGFSLVVTLPRAGNLGGGGFMLIHDADSGKDVAIDYREMAPIRATRDMFLDENGDVDNDKARFSHLSAGVPGTVSGFFAAHQKFGKLPWRRLLQPAIKQARDGIVVSYDMAEVLRQRQERLCRNEAACRYFYKSDGSAYQPGEVIRQTDLAATLEAIAEEGPDAFYKGSIADLIVAEMQRGGGLVDKASLAAYKPGWRTPLRGNYRGHDVLTMPPPSSGGVHILQMLNILENFAVGDLGAGSADNVHLLAEVARLAYADRSKHLGDPDYYDVPVSWLTSKDYASKLAANIDLQRARDSDDVHPGVPPAFESEDTTHYSVMDSDGNVVSNTYTLNFRLGQGLLSRVLGFY